MKKYVIALILILLLASCGVPDIAEVTTTPTTTAATTFEMTTTATNATTTTAITSITTTEFYNDDEQTFENLIAEKTGCDEIRSFSCDGNQFIYTYYSGVINRQEIWRVDGDNFYKAPISNVGINLTIDENEDITLMAVAVDNFTMYDDNINGANTWKPYYFYFDNGFHEYGGSEIPLEELLEFENAESYIDEIESLNGEITNILKRGNGIININYRVPDPEVDYLKWNYYYTLKIDDGKVTHITDNPDKPEWDSGVYLPALLPEIATYT
jgi:major membrane immunogen (membrane-anchored lipoprotein)